MDTQWWTLKIEDGHWVISCNIKINHTLDGKSFESSQGERTEGNFCGGGKFWH